MENLNEDLIGIPEVCGILRMTPPVIYGKIGRGDIPYIRVPNSNRILFSKKALSEWLIVNAATPTVK